MEDHQIVDHNNAFGYTLILVEISFINFCKYVSVRCHWQKIVSDDVMNYMSLQNHHFLNEDTET